jgi:nitrite reductase/ring-hydroxylating ferredoxin subunit
MDEQGHPAGAERDEPRRSFLTTASGALMTAGLALGYGTFGVMLARFVYPAASRNRGWRFVCIADSLARGEAIDFTAPAGARIVVARQGPGAEADDFLALSSVCPHLGCQVHWEPQNDRFFCPCHNGAFDRSGKAIAGPPQAANQTLVRFPVKVEEGLLYVEAPLTSLASLPQASAERRLS